MEFDFNKLTYSFVVSYEQLM